jgi:hypothetical protein
VCGLVLTNRCASNLNLETSLLCVSIFFQNVANVRSYGDTKITKVIMFMIIKAVAIVMCQDCTN